MIHSFTIFIFSFCVLFSYLEANDSNDKVIPKNLANLSIKDMFINQDSLDSEDGSGSLETSIASSSIPIWGFSLFSNSTYSFKLSYLLFLLINGVSSFLFLPYSSPS